MQPWQWNTLSKGFLASHFMDQKETSEGSDAAFSSVFQMKSSQICASEILILIDFRKYMFNKSKKVKSNCFKVLDLLFMKIYFQILLNMNMKFKCMYPNSQLSVSIVFIQEFLPLYFNIYTSQGK